MLTHTAQLSAIRDSASKDDRHDRLDKVKLRLASSASAVDRDASLSHLPLIVIIDSRVLVREVLARALEEEVQIRSRVFCDLDSWFASDCRRSTSAILLRIGEVKSDNPGLMKDLQRIVVDDMCVPVVVLGDNSDLSHIVDILAQGVRGYIPTNVDLRIAAAALSLVLAGGVYLPASSILEGGQLCKDPNPDIGRIFDLTKRQVEIADRVFCGKPNKVIAHELNVCESTVKVHIRTIMKKLQVRNRTEVAFRLRAAQLRPFPSTQPSNSSGVQKEKKRSVA